MKRCALLLALLASCAAVGEATQGTTEAAGVTLLAVLLSPLVAILSWPAWHWLGDKLSAWLTGTEQIRVAVLDDPVAGADALPRTELPLWGGSPLDSLTGGNMLWIILGIAAFIYFGGLTWLKSQIAKAKTEADGKLVAAKKEADEKLVQVQKEDAAWVAALDKDRAAHQAATAALAAEVKLLKELLMTVVKVTPPTV